MNVSLRSLYANVSVKRWPTSVGVAPVPQSMRVSVTSAGACAIAGRPMRTVAHTPTANRVRALSIGFLPGSMECGAIDANYASTAMVAHRGRDRRWISALACRMVPAVRRFIVSSVVACALVLPFVLWGFRTYQLAFAGTHAIAIVGLNLIAGQAGLISLGHGAFYGLGGYTLAVMMRHAGVSAYVGILAASLMCLAAGYLFGRVVARLTRFYLALATFALALAVPQTLKSSYLHPWTGGVQGLYLDRPGAPGGLPLRPGSMVVPRDPGHPCAAALDGQEPGRRAHRARDPRDA